MGSDRRGRDRRPRDERALDLGQVDSTAPDLDLRVLPAEHREHAVLGHPADVARAKGAIAEAPFRELVVLPVTG
jgi:hypothetical protein